MTETGEKESYCPSAALLLALSLLAVLFLRPYFDAPREVSQEEVEAAINERLRFEAAPSERFVLSGTIDVNMAGADEISLLPGIGEILAARIVEKRTMLGGFRTVEELKTVKGLGEAKFSAIRPYVRIELPAFSDKKGR